MRVVERAPDYTVQLMLGIYDFVADKPPGAAGSATGGRERSRYPQRFTVEHVLGHRPLRGGHP